MELTGFKQEFLLFLSSLCQKEPSAALPREIHGALAGWVMARIAKPWNDCRGTKLPKRANYLSLEYLVGRAVYNNLLNLGILDEVATQLKGLGIDPAVFEELEDAALGNGGLGRLAACFLDSAASCHLPVEGYGLRYRYGLFRQRFEDGFQRESPDDWKASQDPWSVRRESEAVRVTFAPGQTVLAVPYDMPVIGWGGQTIGTLRLWQGEPVNPLDLATFNAGRHMAANREELAAENLCHVLYPGDETTSGKQLRLRQQYLLSAASVADVMRRHLLSGHTLEELADRQAIQLNDTHPVIAIPEMIRILVDDCGWEFEKALALAGKVFSYTNHTIMPEAMETWSSKMMSRTLPRLSQICRMINEHLIRSLATGMSRAELREMMIVTGGQIHMARLAVYVCHKVNGVAQIHADILREKVFPLWHRRNPDKIIGLTNGITQRRWLALCNPELAEFITGHIGGDWVTDLNRLRELAPLSTQRDALEQFVEIKQHNKAQLSAVIELREGIKLPANFCFDVQIKRLHEYKRQLLNAFSILDIYWCIKEGSITDFAPTAFIFGGKSAPGYLRAKGIIKYINEIAGLINNDPDMDDHLKVVFVTDYNVSYAERLIPAADISQQISTAGTEASGTGNMKFMLNGAVTVGTRDGANIEIFAEAGDENNYPFGATSQELDALRESYNPLALYAAEPRIARVVDSLVNGTVSDGGTGMFQELHRAILTGASWHKPDHYFLLHDFLPYQQARQNAAKDYGDRLAFARKGLFNTAAAGPFSSDRTIREYATQVWGGLRPFHSPLGG